VKAVTLVEKRILAHDLIDAMDRCLHVGEFEVALNLSKTIRDVVKTKVVTK